MRIGDLSPADLDPIAGQPAIEPPAPAIALPDPVAGAPALPTPTANMPNVDPIAGMPAVDDPIAGMPALSPRLDHEFMADVPDLQPRPAPRAYAIGEEPAADPFAQPGTLNAAAIKEAARRHGPGYFELPTAERFQKYADVLREVRGVDVNKPDYRILNELGPSDPTNAMLEAERPYRNQYRAAAIEATRAAVEADQSYWNLPDDRRTELLNATRAGLGLAPVKVAPGARGFLETLKEKWRLGDEVTKDGFVQRLPFVGVAPSMYNNVQAISIGNKIRAGEKLNDRELSAILDQQEEDLRPRTTLGNAAAIASDAPAMGIEMLGTGGTAGLAKMGLKEGAKQAVKQGLKTLITRGGHRIAAGTAERMAPTLTTNNDPNGVLRGVIAKEGDDIGTALIKSTLDNAIEYTSEFSGPVLEHIAGAVAAKIGADGLKRLASGFVAKMAKETGTEKALQLVRKGMAKGTEFAYDGILGEMGEERVGDLARYVLTEISKQTGLKSLDLGQSSVIPTTDQLAAEAIGFGIYGAGMAGFGTAMEGRARAQRLDAIRGYRSMTLNQARQQAAQQLADAGVESPSQSDVDEIARALIVDQIKERNRGEVRPPADAMEAQPIEDNTRAPAAAADTSPPQAAPPASEQPTPPVPAPNQSAGAPAVAAPISKQEQSNGLQETQEGRQGGRGLLTPPTTSESDNVPASSVAPAQPSPTSGTAAGQTKEPWQMTQAEFVAERQRRIERFRELSRKHGGTPGSMQVPEVREAFNAQQDWGDVDMGHRPAVAQAIRDGKPVPANVRAEYETATSSPPQLQPVKQRPAVQPATVTQKAPVGKLNQGDSVAWGNERGTVWWDKGDFVEVTNARTDRRETIARSNLTKLTPESMNLQKGQTLNIAGMANGPFSYVGPAAGSRLQVQSSDGRTMEVDPARVEVPAPGANQRQVAATAAAPAKSPATGKQLADVITARLRRDLGIKDLQVMLGSPRPDSQHALAGQLLEALGIQVAYFSTSKPIGASMLQLRKMGKGVRIVAINLGSYAGDAKAPVVTAAAMHEWVHDLHETDPAAYGELLQYFKGKAPMLLRHAEETYKSRAKNANMAITLQALEGNDEFRQEEALANAVEYIVLHENLAQQLAKDKPHLLARLIEWLRDLFARLPDPVAREIEMRSEVMKRLMALAPQYEQQLTQQQPAAAPAAADPPKTSARLGDWTKDRVYDRLMSEFTAEVRTAVDEMREQVSNDQAGLHPDDIERYSGNDRRILRPFVNEDGWGERSLEDQIDFILMAENKARREEAVIAWAEKHVDPTMNLLAWYHQSRETTRKRLLDLSTPEKIRGMIGKTLSINGESFIVREDETGQIWLTDTTVEFPIQAIEDDLPVDAGSIGKAPAPTPDPAAIEDQQRLFGREEDQPVAGSRTGSLFGQQQQQTATATAEAPTPTSERPPAAPTATPSTGNQSEMFARQPAARSTAATPGRIGDVGEELWYNRRNNIGKGLRWDDVKDLNATLKAKEVTKSRIWPRPNYEQLVADGLDRYTAHLVKQIYDSLPAGPITRGAATDEQLQEYIDVVTRAREAVFTWAREATKTAGDIEKLATSDSLRADVALTNLYRGADDKLLDLIFPIPAKLDRLNRFRGDDPASVRNLRQVRLLGNNFLRNIQIRYEHARRARTALKEGWPKSQEAWQRMFRIEETPAGTKILENGRERRLEKPDFFIVRKNGRSIEASGFATREAAIEHARGLANQKRGGTDGEGEEEQLPLENVRRAGPQRRDANRDVTPEEFRQAFGFRGVNFGNWTNQAERQAHLNQAYDALVDMAELLNVPAEAISLNGMLGLAFGAQGRGGNAAAHFVPGVNEINLTKTNGAGSLAHEWAHAMDHYFAVQAGERFAKAREPFVTELLASATLNGATGLRPEIVERFREIMDTIKSRPETPAEASARQGQLLTRALRNLESWLKSFRRDLERDARPGEKERALNEFDAIAAKIMRGELGEGYVNAGRGYMTAYNPAIAEIRSLVKDATGRTPTPEQTQGLQNNARYAQGLLAENAAGAKHEPQRVATAFRNAALELDGNKPGKGYWATPVEMFARAFQSYVIDRLGEQAARNDYLSRPQKPNSPRYPAGEERRAINQTFDRLVQAILTRETDRGVAMYSIEDEALTPLDTPEIVEARKRAAAIPPTFNINTPERHAMRDRIASELYGSGAPVKARQAFIIIGPPAAGKSTIAEPLAKAAGALIVDSDKVKEMLPEFQGGIGAMAVHVESAEINEGIFDEAVSSGDNIVLPIIGRDEKALRDRADGLKKNGYQVHLILVNLDRDKTTQRAIRRFQETGRFVDPNYVYNVVGNMPLNVYTQISRSEHGFDSTTHLDSDVPVGEIPRLIQSSDQLPAVLRHVLRGRGLSGRLRAGEAEGGTQEDRGNAQEVRRGTPGQQLGLLGERYDGPVVGSSSGNLFGNISEGPASDLENTQRPGSTDPDQQTLFAIEGQKPPASRRILASPLDLAREVALLHLGDGKAWQELTRDRAGQLMTKILATAPLAQKKLAASLSRARDLAIDLVKSAQAPMAAGASGRNVVEEAVSSMAAVQNAGRARDVQSALKEIRALLDNDGWQLGRDADVLAEAANISRGQALRRQLLDVVKWLPQDLQTRMQDALAKTETATNLRAALERAASLLVAYEKNQEKEIFENLLAGRDTKHLIGDFRKQFEKLVGPLDVSGMSLTSRKMADLLSTWLNTRGQDDRNNGRFILPPNAEVLLERLKKTPIEELTVGEIRTINDTIRAIVRQNAMQTALIRGKSIEDKDKATAAMVEEIATHNELLEDEQTGDKSSVKAQGDVGVLMNTLGGDANSPLVEAVKAAGADSETVRRLVHDVEKGQKKKFSLLQGVYQSLGKVFGDHGMDQVKLIDFINKPVIDEDVRVFEGRDTQTEEQAQQEYTQAQREMLELFGDTNAGTEWERQAVSYVNTAAGTAKPDLQLAAGEKLAAAGITGNITFRGSALDLNLLGDSVLDFDALRKLPAALNSPAMIFEQPNGRRAVVTEQWIGDQRLVQLFMLTPEDGGWVVKPGGVRITNSANTLTMIRAAAVGRMLWVDEGQYDRWKETAQGTESATEAFVLPAPDASTVRHRDSAASPTVFKKHRITMTGAERLAAYLYWQNEDSRAKMLDNGIVIGRFAGSAERTHQITAAELRRIVDTATDFEKALAEAIIRHGDEMFPVLNELHIQMKGFELEKQEKYFPLVLDRAQMDRLADELSNIDPEMWPEKMGLLKRRVRHRVPVVITNALDTFVRSAANSATFAGMAEPVHNARLILGDAEVRDTMDRRLGTRFRVRFEDMLKSEVNAMVRDRLATETALNMITRNLAVATLGLRVPTTVLNYASQIPMFVTQFVGRAYSAERTRALIAQTAGVLARFASSPRKVLEEARQTLFANPYLWYRFDGGGDSAMRVGVQGRAQGGTNLGLPTASTARMQQWRNLQEASMSWMKNAEMLAVYTLQQALQSVHAKDGPNSLSPAEILDLTERITRDTSNPATSLEQSALHRQAKRNGFLGMALMFTGDAAKKRDVVMDAWYRFMRDGGKDGRVNFAKTMTWLAIAVLGVGLAIKYLWQSVMRGFREDEEDKKMGIAWMARNAAFDTAGIAHPALQEIAQQLAGFSGDSLHGRSVSSIYKALQAGATLSSQALSADRRGDKDTMQLLATFFDQMLRGAGGLAGVPINTPLDLITAGTRAANRRPVEFELQQELTRLRRQTAPDAINLRDRRGSLTPQEYGRFKSLENINRNIGRIRRLEKDGKLKPEAADRAVAELLRAAQRINNQTTSIR